MDFRLNSYLLAESPHYPGLHSLKAQVMPQEMHDANTAWVYYRHLVGESLQRSSALTSTHKQCTSIDRVSPPPAAALHLQLTIPNQELSEASTVPIWIHARVAASPHSSFARHDARLLISEPVQGTARSCGPATGRLGHGTWRW